jgi:Ethanolamine utilization protein EutJ (predicted chaperonin)
MRWIRTALALLGAVATAAAVLVQEPQVFAFTGIAGIVAFVLAAGCLAADAIPYRPAHAAAAVLSLVDAVVLAVGGRTIGIPVILPAAFLVVLQVAPAARARWITRGPRPGYEW